MRLATYNVEWFDALFDDEGKPVPDTHWSRRRDVTRREQLAALVRVFQAMDADAILVVEAPDDSRNRNARVALQEFAEFAGLRTRQALLGFANDTQQEIMLLFDPDVIRARHDPIGSGPDEVARLAGRAGAAGAGAGAGGEAAGADHDPPVPRFDGAFHLDTDLDMHPDPVVWSKPPLEIAATAGDFAFRMIGVHAKSKAPHGARTIPEATRLAIDNRRKQLAQCIWLRHRVEWHLRRDEPLIVLGDFNDGPGLDEYERLFGRSSIEIVMGENPDDPLRLYDPHAQALLASRMGAAPVSARFYIAEQKRYLSALLDYVMLGPAMMQRNPRWRIWHPFDDPEIYRNPELRDALLTASDHFPVTVDFSA
ncbi:endonuclease [Brevirhabdus pacifica]|uniref:Endonuclease n=2 Tax=Brevirhabdus pacifica TaxID=1267768 RepID=A0A1U7DL65_9RHOB|nr:endonuclease/exonuclease/phosphatase family protein [Brevirhabdus pacifica]APX90629.1 endonuclease [Brevirhabdus pacifica]OWU78380.1 endonuclease [Loktanella sp. 22II-4b]PJJ85229.1 endonuclease/exonuclease/phosphatase family protein [Brevirhabdus pacifica]